MRYRSKPTGKMNPLYRFGFSAENLRELKQMKRRLEKVFLALICAYNREICCLPYEYFEQLISRRRDEKARTEEEYVVEVNLEEGMRFRVAISPPSSKGRWLGKPFVIPRADLPRRIFRRSR